ncbi:uncharacterized protein ACLA_030500 [Aspergillus clavatus NRRL 1]|uniref:Uncharacterized protein n=1 Tax=Aspergillus clavatus (strain ATCC 1007 / CBS 513.65 / DSM 816 / NCTC 3887 / NRRL 1 / QM 1276 / 107) TaxID=344612 RepID=A1CRP6_ASPCL|nr:uncharacterized protein ACLA_030500 [Aspergillus clavatus NRRL 1]EAW08317.1 hypothetical protein ACLA_030500 [Aspergillus clavatus NRRL 1]
MEDFMEDFDGFEPAHIIPTSSPFSQDSLQKSERRVSTSSIPRPSKTDKERLTRDDRAICVSLPKKVRNKRASTLTKLQQHGE